MAVMIYSWDGNCVALAMHHRYIGIPIYVFNGLGKEMNTLPMLQ